MTLRTSLRLLGAALLVACQSPTGDNGPKLPVPPVPSETPLQLRKADAESGDGQTGEVGTKLPKPLRVLVTTNGVPKAGVVVVWAVPSGLQSDMPTSITDSNGIATATYTMSTRAGLETVDAGFERNIVPGRAQFTFIAKAGVAATVAKHTGDLQEITTNPGDPVLPLSVGARDRYGNATQWEDVDVSWAVVDGPVVIDRVFMADAASISSASVKAIGKAGVAHVRAVVVSRTEAIDSSTLDFTILVSPRIYEVTIHALDDDTTTVFRSEGSGRIPALDTVLAPATIRFTHQAYWDVYTGAQHQIVWPNLEFPPSPIIKYGQTHSVTLTKPGVYRYRSSWSSRLAGTVVVR